MPADARYGNGKSVAPGVRRLRHFIELTKPRVMALAVFTAVAGMMLAPGNPDPLRALTSVAAIALGAGAAGALNMWYDADLDARMARTARRPVPAGAVRPGEALGFGLVLSAVSVGALTFVANALAAALLAFTIFFYAVIYTIWLKRATPQNIVIGGAAGALPPVIGWAAVSGEVAVEPLILFLIIFLWTPPHFWALALIRVRDYAAAGVPMMPNVAGEASTRRQIFVYSLLLAPAALLPWAIGMAGSLYGAAAGFMGLAFVHRAWVLMRAKGEAQARGPARALFGWSILYLFLIFAALLADVAIGRLWAITGPR